MAQHRIFAERKKSGYLKSVIMIANYGVPYVSSRSFGLGCTSSRYFVRLMGVFRRRGLRLPGDRHCEGVDEHRAVGGGEVIVDDLEQTAPAMQTDLGESQGDGRRHVVLQSVDLACEVRVHHRGLGRPGSVDRPEECYLHGVAERGVAESDLIQVREKNHVGAGVVEGVEDGLPILCVHPEEQGRVGVHVRCEMGVRPPWWWVDVE